MPRFSLVVPAYQAASTLSETLDGLLAQTFVDWNCVVVDDGSTDSTLQIASGYAAADPRIRVLHQDNQGTAGAYNTGVSSVDGEFVVICSADDILLPQHLATMSTFIDSELGYDIYASNGYYWLPGRSRWLVYEGPHGARAHSLRLANIIRVCFYGVGATYRRELFARIDGYRTDVFAEDYDFWLRALASGARHRYVPAALSLFRLGETQKSASIELVHQSGIRLVTELKRDFALSEEEVRAVDESIVERERLISDLHRPWGLWRSVLRPAARRVVFALLGRETARRVKRIVRSALRPR